VVTGVIIGAAPGLASVANPASRWDIAMIPAQCRAARGLLNWDQGRIAVAARVDVEIVHAFEDERPVQRAMSDAIQRAFERAGIEFTNGGAPGVRLRPPPRAVSIQDLNASNDE
jgi:hypothetical protein